MTLTSQLIENNKTEFINLISSIEREGAQTEALIEMLSNSDFFVAPASKNYHNSIEGGLCDHCLNVYRNLLKLVELHNLSFDADTLKIVALLHDVSKMNMYKKGIKNEKVYCPNGSKYDQLGNYEWVSSELYVSREDVFVYGSHECTAEYITRQYIPLTLEESVAIIHHMGSMSWDSAKDNIGEVYNRYTLALLLYMADMTATYITENPRYE